MRLIALLVLVFGVVLAGGAIFFASDYFRKMEAAMLASQSSGPETVGVLVADATLSAGDPLTKDKVRIDKFLKHNVPDGAFTSVEALFGAANEDPRFVIRTIEKDLPILARQVTDFGDKPTLSSNLEDGKRAFSISIDPVTGVAGFVTAGSRVDVLLTYRVGNDMESQIVLTDILVIAIDQQDDKEASSPRLGRTATLSVTPSDAQKLAVFQQKGKLTLLLRGITETGDTQTGAMSAEELLGLQAPVPEPVAPPPVAAPPVQVRVRCGGKICDTVEVPNEE